MHSTSSGFSTFTTNQPTTHSDSARAHHRRCTTGQPHATSIEKIGVAYAFPNRVSSCTRVGRLLGVQVVSEGFGVFFGLGFTAPLVDTAAWFNSSRAALFYVDRARIEGGDSEKGALLPVCV
jgi:hypothetical protein